MGFGSYRLGGRFAQLTNFISDLESRAPEFYTRIGENLSQWKKPAPKINDLADAADVGTIASDAEDY